MRDLISAAFVSLMTRFYSITLLLMLACKAGLTVDAGVRENWPRTERPSRERKPFSIEVTNLIGAKEKLTLRIFPGKQDEMDVHDRAAKICIVNKPPTSCYFARVDDMNFARYVQASLVEMGEGQIGVLFQAENLGVSDESKLVAILGLRSRGRLVNLLPRASVSTQDQFRLWHDAELSRADLITTANYDWRLGPPEEETHFAFHHYRVVTYEFCPRAGRYLLVDQFTTRRKFAGLDDEDHPGDRVLNAMMPQVKKRLLQNQNTGKQTCEK